MGHCLPECSVGADRKIAAVLQGAMRWDMGFRPATRDVIVHWLRDFGVEHPGTLAPPLHPETSMGIGCRTPAANPIGYWLPD